MTTPTLPKPTLRRIINCAKALMRRQGFSRHYAVKAALKIVARAGDKAPLTTTTKPANYARAEAALEYLHHRNRTLAAGARRH